MTLSLALRRIAVGVSIVVSAAAGGCANEGIGGLFSTGAISEPAPAATVAKANVDPACVSLSAQIDAVRKEGSVERLEKAADGKTVAVNVQRAALAKQSQLNKLNADFIAKCGPNLPKSSVTASLATPAIPAAATVAKPVAAAAKPVVVKAAAAANTSGVTVVPSAPAAVVAPQ